MQELKWFGNCGWEGENVSWGSEGRESYRFTRFNWIYYLPGAPKAVGAAAGAPNGVAGAGLPNGAGVGARNSITNVTWVFWERKIEMKFLHCWPEICTYQLQIILQSQELEHQTILQLQGLFRCVFLRQVYNNEKPYSKYQDWAYIIYIIQFLPGAEPNKLPPAGFPKEGAGVGANDANRQLI